MFKKWIRFLLVLGIILAIAACTPQKETSPKADAPAQQSAQDNDQGDQVGADQDTESDDDGAADSEGGDVMAEETTEEESEPAPPPIDAAEVFAQNCASCHGDKRQGGGGPPLLPENLSLEASAYAKTITDGKGSRMPAWGGKLSEDVIKALSEWILTPVE